MTTLSHAFKGNDRLEINKIAIVGGFQGFENDPDSNDYKMVMPALDYLKKTGISVSDKPEFDVINFADGRNFLDEDQNYDMVFIAHIPNGRNLSWTRMSFNDYSTWTDVSDQSKLQNTIDRRNSPDRWAQRIADTGASIVMGVATWIEVGANYLNESKLFNGYNTLIAPKHDSTLVGRADIFSTKEMPLLYGDDIDLPYQWLSISINETKLSAFSAQAKGETDLTKKLHSVVKSVSKQKAFML